MTFADLTPAQWREYDESLLRRHPEWIQADPTDGAPDRPSPREASGEEE